jgi:hypothetical protein
VILVHTLCVVLKDIRRGAGCDLSRLPLAVTQGQRTWPRYRHVAARPLAALPSCYFGGGGGGGGGVQPSTSGCTVQPFCGCACSPAVEEASWPCAIAQKPATVALMFAALYLGKFSQVSPFCRSVSGIVSMTDQ